MIVISIFFINAIFGSSLKEEVIDKNAALQKQMLTQPIISGMSVPTGQMNVTIAFQKTREGYWHCCTIFEHIRQGEINCKTIHLGVPRGTDGYYGGGVYGGTSNITIGSHSEHDIRSKIIGEFYLDDTEKKIKKQSPAYKKFVSFTTNDVFDDVWRQAENDSKLVQFSLMADYWGEGPNGRYNCCSYAHKVLNYCGIQIPFNASSDRGGFFNTKNDLGFMKALRDFANSGSYQNVVKLHAEGLQILE